MEENNKKHENIENPLDDNVEIKTELLQRIETLQGEEKRIIADISQIEAALTSNRNTLVSVRGGILELSKLLEKFQKKP